MLCSLVPLLPNCYCPFIILAMVVFATALLALPPYDSTTLLPNWSYPFTRLKRDVSWWMK